MKTEHPSFWIRHQQQRDILFLAQINCQMIFNWSTKGKNCFNPSLDKYFRSIWEGEEAVATSYSALCRMISIISSFDSEFTTFFSVLLTDAITNQFSFFHQSDSIGITRRADSWRENQINSGLPCQCRFVAIPLQRNCIQIQDKIIIVLDKETSTYISDQWVLT